MFNPAVSFAQSAPVATVQLNFIEVVLNDEHRNGVDWASIVKDFQQVSLKKEDNPIWMDKRYKLSVGNVSQEDYEVLIDALDTVGKLRQWPQLAQDIVYDVPLELTVPGQEVNVKLRLKKDQLGRDILMVEPHVYLAYEDLKKNQEDHVWFKTQMDIECDGDKVIVLGSMHEKEEMTAKMKFPLLGDIPLLGLVFRHQGKLMQKTEKIIFIQWRFNKELADQK
jgi:hypothetical protein